MEIDNDLILMLHPGGKKSKSLGREKYEVLSLYILTMAKETTNLSMSHLLEKAKQQSFFVGDADVPWNLLNVKLDLEMRGLIQMEVLQKRRRVMAIRLSKKGMKVLRDRRFNELGIDYNVCDSSPQNETVIKTFLLM